MLPSPPSDLSITHCVANEIKELRKSGRLWRHHLCLGSLFGYLFKLNVFWYSNHMNKRGRIDFACSFICKRTAIPIFLLRGTTEPSFYFFCLLSPNIIQWIVFFLPTAFWDEAFVFSHFRFWKKKAFICLSSQLKWFSYWTCSLFALDLCPAGKESVYKRNGYPIA